MIHYPWVDRPPMHEVMLSFAELLAQRSTCERLKVGAVVTDAEMLQVLGIGYNGNARGLPNACDTHEPGQCGCVHAEMNALLKASGIVTGKLLFTSHSPCLMCAKAIINAGVSTVYYRHRYRLADEAFRIFVQAGVKSVSLMGPPDAPPG